MLWLQIYIKLPEINGAASFNNLGPMLSKPVDFVRLIFFRYFSTLYTPPHNNGRVLWFHTGRPCVCLSIRSFPDDNLNKHWIFTKFGMCIDIVEIWFGIANWQISSNFYGVICLRHAHISFQEDNFSK